MDALHYQEMAENLEALVEEGAIQDKGIYLFGHCNATEELADLLLSEGFAVTAILDNNPNKEGKTYRDIVIRKPEAIMKERQGQTLVCIAARAYAAMAAQLTRMGYTGRVVKLVDYNTYAEYSLTPETIVRRRQRAERGREGLLRLRGKYPGHFLFLCPFCALGDIYIMMSYLPWFLQKRDITSCVIAVIGNACGQVVRLFGDYPVEIFTQREMDETIQAALYFGEQDFFIPHQDRPYVVNLSKALYIKRIPLEKIYCCGVFGLSEDTIPCRPVYEETYEGPEEIIPGKSVILAPHAKSVTALKPEIWDGIVKEYRDRGYACYTNVAGEEKALTGTKPVSATLAQIRSLVETAGTFIGIRSGLCDVIRDAACKKIALYPDYQYSDTKWKAIDMYWLEGWENIVVGEEK
mgnify:CR=1 FL=1